MKYLGVTKMSKFSFENKNSNKDTCNWVLEPNVLVVLGKKVVEISVGQSCKFCTITFNEF